MLHEHKWSLGVLCILTVALIWSASSVLVQAIFTQAHFSKPFFLTWVANSLFMVTIPIRAAFLSIRRRMRVGSSSSSEPDAEGSSIGPPEDTQHTLRAGILVAPVWFAANCTYNMSMSLTSITATTIISSSSAGFTLLLSAVWLGENVTVLKVIGVVLCMTGNILMVYSDDGGGGTRNATTVHNGTDAEGSAHASVQGDVVCLLSAMLYAWYTTLIRRFSPQDLSLFFGFLGLTTFLAFGPIVALLHWTHLEDISGLTPAVFGLLLCKGLFDNVLSDYLWATAVLLTSPSVATIGMSLTVPLAILSDLLLPEAWLVDPTVPTPLSLLSAVAVVGGFVAINVASSGEDGGGCRCASAMQMPLLASEPRRSDGDETRDEQRTATGGSHATRGGTRRTSTRAGGQHAAGMTRGRAIPAGSTPGRGGADADSFIGGTNQQSARGGGSEAASAAGR